MSSLLRTTFLCFPFPKLLLTPRTSIAFISSCEYLSTEKVSKQIKICDHLSDNKQLEREVCWFSSSTMKLLFKHQFMNVFTCYYEFQIFSRENSNRAENMCLFVTWSLALFLLEKRIQRGGKPKQNICASPRKCFCDSTLRKKDSPAILKRHVGEYTAK